MPVLSKAGVEIGHIRKLLKAERRNIKYNYAVAW
jgi:hypothetical protein